MFCVVFVTLQAIFSEFLIYFSIAVSLCIYNRELIRNRTYLEDSRHQSYTTCFRHSAVLSLPAVLLRKLPVNSRLETSMKQ